MVPAEHVGAPILVGPEPVGGAVEQTVNDLDRVLQHVAASATRIQTEADAMAERVRVEVAAFAERHRELATRVLDTQRARQEAAASDGVFHHTRSPELIGAPADVSAQIETIDIRDPGAQVAWGNGAHCQVRPRPLTRRKVPPISGAAA